MQSSAKFTTHDTAHPLHTGYIDFPTNHPQILHTLLGTVHTLHFTLHTVFCTVHIVFCTVYYTVHTVYCIVYIVYHKTHTV